MAMNPKDGWKKWKDPEHGARKGQSNSQNYRGGGGAGEVTQDKEDRFGDGA